MRNILKTIKFALLVMLAVGTFPVSLAVFLYWEYLNSAEEDDE